MSPVLPRLSRRPDNAALWRLDYERGGLRSATFIFPNGGECRMTMLGHFIETGDGGHSRYASASDR